MPAFEPTTTSMAAHRSSRTSPFTLTLNREHPCIAAALTLIDHCRPDTAPIAQAIPCFCRYRRPERYYTLLDAFVRNDFLSPRNYPELDPASVPSLVEHVVQFVGDANAAHCCDAPTVPCLAIHVYPPDAAEPEPGPAPASSASIAELRQARVGAGELGPCAVCLNEMDGRGTAVRMPCSHVYHEECIVEWLKKSNICPLCRFQMPVSATSTTQVHES